MAPKKAAADIAAAPPPPPDPEVLAQQERLEKWNQRAAELQKKQDDMLKYVNAARLKQKECEDKIASLFEKAGEIAANKKQPAAQLANAPSAPVGKPPKGAAAAKAVAEVPVATETQQTQQEIDEENKKKAKITHHLMVLYKKKRQQQPSATTGVTQSGSGVMTPRDGAAAQDDSPRSPTSSPTAALPPSLGNVAGELFVKHPDVPSDLWAAMLALREERLEAEVSLVHLKQCVAKGDAHWQQLKAMGSLSSYAVVGSEHGLKQASTKADDRASREQAAAKELSAAAVVAAPAAGATPPPKKK